MAHEAHPAEANLAPPTVLVISAGGELRSALDAALSAAEGRFEVEHVDSEDDILEVLAGRRPSLVLVDGPDARARAHTRLLRSLVEPSPPSAVIALVEAPSAVVEEGTPGELPAAGLAALPALIDARLEAHTAAREKQALARDLETVEACRPLFTCLEPGKLYPQALDVLLARLGRDRGLALFRPRAAPRQDGMALRGFSEEANQRICQLVLEEKALGPIDTDTIRVSASGPMQRLLAEAGCAEPGEILTMPVEGQENESGVLWIMSGESPFTDGDIAAARIVARSAATALETAERYHHAKERAFIDDVTEVYNARYLLSTTHNEIQRAARYGNPLSVLFLDLDRFKLVNDKYGHLIGSDTLRALSRLLADAVRQVDTLARYGGDEFTILLVDTDHEEALQIAERIRRLVEDHIFEAGPDGPLRLSISIGVATCPGHGETRETLLDAADKAMYRAKSMGRNRVCSAGALDE